MKSSSWIRLGPNLMTGIFIRCGRTHRHAGEKAETGGVHLPANECQRCPLTMRIQKRHQRFPSGATGGTRPCQHFDFRPRATIAVKKIKLLF